MISTNYTEHYCIFVKIRSETFTNYLENDQNFNEVATEKQKSHNQLLGGI